MGRLFEVRVLSRYCKGCGLCVEFCRQGKLTIQEKPNRQGIRVAAVKADVECTGCMRCALMCPDAAIELVRLGETSTVGARAEADDG
jgi:2-oxoglutarate ferredoxin oxidoreductase subunit delta